MLDARYGRSSVPQDYISLQLCRLYHCRPSELKEEDWREVGAHLMLVGIENELRKLP